jgi:hypothetical protein
MSPPETSTTKHHDANAYRNVFSQSWFGIAPLWKAFWIVGVAGHVLVLMSTEFMLGLVPRSILTKSAMIWSGTSWLTYFAYAVFSSICIWRCAENASSPVWAALARAAVALNALFVAFGILLLLATGGS